MSSKVQCKSGTKRILALARKNLIVDAKNYELLNKLVIRREQDCSFKKITSRKNFI